MKTVAFIILLSGIVVLAASLPLAWRQVPMNRLWGFRVAPAFESDLRWFSINAYGGRLLAWSSCLIMTTGLVGFILPDECLNMYVWSSTMICLAAVLTPCAQTVRWAHRSP
jgi:hypothetical protein